MGGERVLCLIDFSNVSGQCFSEGRRPNFPALRQFVAGHHAGTGSVDARIYAPLPHDNGVGVIRFHDWLKSQGFMVVSKRAKQLPDKRHKANFDVEITIDALEAIHESKPDVIVLASGDGDFAPLAKRLRLKGICVEVASLGGSLATELRLNANAILDLQPWLAQCDLSERALPRAAA